MGGIATVTAQLYSTSPHSPDIMDLKIALILVVIPVAVFAATETICEGKVANLRCKEGTIKIKSAMYGRQNKQSCKDSNANNINCSAGRAETKVKNKCDVNLTVTLKPLTPYTVIHAQVHPNIWKSNGHARF